MADTTTSQNIDLSSWDILYIINLLTQHRDSEMNYLRL
jgi:hypothetical protein